MTRLLAACALLFPLLAGPVSAAEPWPAVVTPADMRSLYTTPGLRIVDLRSEAAYRAGHADGAVWMPMEVWKAARPAELPGVINRAGIHPDRPILLVHEDTGPENLIDTAWVAWELKRRGVPSVSVLEGGMDAWQRAGVRLTTRVHDHGIYRLRFEPQPPGLEPGEVDRIRRGAAEGGLIEATASADTAAARPGIVRVSLDDLLNGERPLSDRVTLLERLKNMPLPFGDGPLVVFGESVEPAAAFWFLAGEVLDLGDLTVLPEPPAGLGATDQAG